MAIVKREKNIYIALVGISFLTLLCHTVTPHAQPLFDETITKAAADSVAKKLGALRGAFKLSELPDFVDSNNEVSTNLSRSFTSKSGQPFNK